MPHLSAAPSEGRDSFACRGPRPSVGSVVTQEVEQVVVFPRRFLANSS